MSSVTIIVATLIVALAGLCQGANIPVQWKAPLSVTYITATCGDNLVFNFRSKDYSVVQIANKTCCDAANVHDFGHVSAVTVPLNKAGLTYYKSGVKASQCARQLLTVRTVCLKGVTHLITTASGHPEWSDEYGHYDTLYARCGDKLRFKWAGDEHDLVEFQTEAKYSSCDFHGAAILSTRHEDWDTTVTLVKAGTTYYGCTVHNHCVVGMKIKVVTTC